MPVRGSVGAHTPSPSSNTAAPDVLQLAADVIGNLASVDEGAVERMDGLKALAKGLQRRQAAAAAPGPGSGSGSAPAAAATESGSIVETVGRWLLDDGADRGLVRAMLAHSADAGLVSACLRSLQVWRGVTRGHLCFLSPDRAVRPLRSHPPLGAVHSGGPVSGGAHGGVRAARPRDVHGAAGPGL